ncbi:MAG: glycosyltransferase family 4 protein [Rudaea sp.]
MYIYRLSHALADEGHNIDVIHDLDSYYLLHPGEPEIPYAEHAGVIRHPLKSRFGKLSPFLTQQTGRPLLKEKEIRAVADSRPYDVLHYHNTSLLGPTLYELEPARGPAVKLYTTHEHWLICPTHVLWKFNRGPCDKPECLRCTLMAGKLPQVWRYTGLLERTGRSIDQFVSPSRFTAQMHADRGFPYPVAHLPYFIERVDRDWQSPGPRPQEKPYFLFVGRMEYIKGLQTLIDLWKRVPEYDLLVAGTGTYENALREQAAGNPHIRFLGPLTQQALGALYYHSIACIVPSITYETFGQIIIEAFARKTPVIVRDLGALPEVVDDSRGGFVYRSDEELLRAMKQLAECPSERGELGERGYQAFVRHWSKEAHIELYMGFVRENAIRKFGRVPWEEEGAPVYSIPALAPMPT